MMDSFSDSGSSISSSSSSSSSHSFSDFSSSSHGSDSMFGSSGGSLFSSSSSHSFSDFSSSSHGSDSMFGSSGGTLFSSSYGASFEGGGGSSGGGGASGSWGNDFSAPSSSMQSHYGSGGLDHNRDWADIPGGQSDTSPQQENLPNPLNADGIGFNPNAETPGYPSPQEDNFLSPAERLTDYTIDSPAHYDLPPHSPGWPEPSGIDNNYLGSLSQEAVGAHEGLVRDGLSTPDNPIGGNLHGLPISTFEPNPELPLFDIPGIGSIYDQPIGPSTEPPILLEIPGIGTIYDLPTTMPNEEINSLPPPDSPIPSSKTLTEEVDSLPGPDSPTPPGGMPKEELSSLPEPYSPTSPLTEESIRERLEEWKRVDEGPKWEEFRDYSEVREALDQLGGTFAGAGAILDAAFERVDGAFRQAGSLLDNLVEGLDAHYKNKSHIDNVNEGRDTHYEHRKEHKE